MVKLSAASRLRDQVLNEPNTVLLIAAGIPDRVVRFNRLPESILRWRKQKASERGDEDIRTVYTPLDLDRGPDGECWTALREEIRKCSRRDIPAPEPLSVADNSNEEWSVSPEDVPTVELTVEVVSATSPVPEKRGPGRPKKED